MINTRPFRRSCLLEVASRKVHTTLGSNIILPSWVVASRSEKFDRPVDSENSFAKAFSTNNNIKRSFRSTSEKNPTSDSSSSKNEGSLWTSTFRPLDGALREMRNDEPESRQASKSTSFAIPRYDNKSKNPRNTLSPKESSGNPPAPTRGHSNHHQAFSQSIVRNPDRSFIITRPGCLPVPGPEFYTLAKHDFFNLHRFHRETGILPFNNHDGSKFKLQGVKTFGSTAYISTWHNEHRVGNGFNLNTIKRDPSIFKYGYDYLQKTDPLWWGCSTQKGRESQLTKKVVRAHTSRRFRLAIVRSLEKHGFDRVGKRIKGEGPDLEGSLSVLVFIAAIQMDHGKLQSAADTLIRNVIEAKFGRNINSKASRGLQQQGMPRKSPGSSQSPRRSSTFSNRAGLTGRWQ